MTVLNGNNLDLVVNGVTLPVAKYGGYTVHWRPMVAYADRTPKTMRIDYLGDVWEINWTIPPQPDEASYLTIYNALKGRIVYTVTFFNPFTQTRMTSTFYRTDIELKRLWRNIHEELKIDLIGTEII